ncbi:MAG: TerC family protein [Candidatus Omnitrophica bacterium]|nr:TerC family protein [Candidatus Omnitrophota bacterium]
MTTSISPMVWIAFNVGILALICLDALVINPKGKEMSFRRALGMTAFWLSLALVFNLGVYFYLGNQLSLEFLTAYVVEQSLSVDNIFVFLLIFAHFKVAPLEQQRILLWGVISAQVMRAVFILSGIGLMNHFHWMIYVFGCVLLFTGIKLFFKQDEEIHPEDSFILKLVGKNLPKFLIVLIVIETTDLIFAIDSIPAVLSITKNSFIAYSSNIFAILGLRAMYFALANFMKVLHHLHYGLGIILTFVGFKMVMENYIHIPVVVTLGFIILTLTVTVMTSILCQPKTLQK